VAQPSAADHGNAEARVLHQLAWCTARTGDTDKALVYYENLFAKYPGYTGKHQAMWEAADLYLTAGDKKHASSLLEKLAKVPSWEKKARKKREKIK
jgi:tetratricopeptide (TPR) repeat protein